MVETTQGYFLTILGTYDQRIGGLVSPDASFLGFIDGSLLPVSAHGLPSVIV